MLWGGCLQGPGSPAGSLTRFVNEQESIGQIWSLQPVEEAPHPPRGAISYHSQRLRSRGAGQRLRIDARTREKLSFQWPESEGPSQKHSAGFQSAGCVIPPAAHTGQTVCQTPPEFERLLPRPAGSICLSCRPCWSWGQRRAFIWDGQMPAQASLSPSLTWGFVPLGHTSEPAAQLPGRPRLPRSEARGPPTADSTFLGTTAYAPDVVSATNGPEG